MDDELLTPEEVALVLRVEVRFVRRRVAERRLPFTKVGKYLRFYRRDMDNFVAAGRVEPIVVSWSGGRAVA